MGASRSGNTLQYILYIYINIYIYIYIIIVYIYIYLYVIGINRNHVPFASQRWLQGKVAHVGPRADVWLPGC